MSSKNDPTPALSGQMRIGQLADLLRVSTKTIRHYHKLGLMPKADRSKKGYRLYGVADLYRLKLILRLKEVGFSLSDIGGILQAEDADAALRKQLELLDRDLTAKIEGFREQLQRVHDLMEASATLEHIERPAREAPRVSEILVEVSMVYPENVSDFAQQVDVQLLTRLEEFNWGAGAREYWLALSKELTSEGNYLSVLGGHLQKTADLEVGDPRLEAMAFEIATAFNPPASLPEAPPLDEPVQVVFQQVLSDSIREILNPAQLRLLGLVQRKLQIAGKLQDPP